jgi:hypothetical protein
LEGQVLPAARDCFVDEFAVALDLCFRGFDGAREAGVLVTDDLARFAPTSVNGVAESLGRAVGAPACAQHLEAKPTLVEGLLRDASGTIQFRSHPIPESHVAPAVESF